MSKAKQKAPNTYVEAARAIAASQRLVSFCDAIKVDLERQISYLFHI
jgi:hypothetical protein